MNPRRCWRVGAALGGLLWLSSFGPGCEFRADPAPSQQVSVEPLPDDSIRNRNLILITVDTLRADRLGAYGSLGARTPNLDTLAARALRAERAYTTFPKTAPAVASLMTGRYPSRHGLRDNGALPGEERTLAERLRSAGFHTAAFVGNPILRARSGFDRGFDLYDDRMPDRIPTRNGNERTASPLVRAVAAGLAETQEPFFLWVHFMDPHGPYTPPGFKRLIGKLESRSEGSRQLPWNRTTNYVRGEIPKYQVLPGARAVGTYLALHDLEVEYVDREVGRLLDLLGRRGWLEQALVVFTSDHGEALGEGDYFFQHGNSLMEAELRVPLLFAAPDIPPGVLAEPVSLADVVPTVLGHLDPGLVEDDPDGGQRIDLRRAAAGRPFGDAAADRMVLSERLGEFAAIDGDYKLVWNLEERTSRLYDLASDPNETVDVAASQPERTVRLRAAISALASQTTTPDSQAPDEATRMNLQALGYVD